MQSSTGLKIFGDLVTMIDRFIRDSGNRERNLVTLFHGNSLMRRAALAALRNDYRNLFEKNRLVFGRELVACMEDSDLFVRNAAVSLIGVFNYHEAMGALYAQTNNPNVHFSQTVRATLEVLQESTKK